MTIAVRESISIVHCLYSRDIIKIGLIEKDEDMTARSDRLREWKQNGDGESKVALDR